MIAKNHVDNAYDMLASSFKSVEVQQLLMVENYVVFGCCHPFHYRYRQFHLHYRQNCIHFFFLNFTCNNDWVNRKVSFYVLCNLNRIFCNQYEINWNN